MLERLPGAGRGVGRAGLVWTSWPPSRPCSTASRPRAARTRRPARRSAGAIRAPSVPARRRAAGPVARVTPCSARSGTSSPSMATSSPTSGPKRPSISRRSRARSATWSGPAPSRDEAELHALFRAVHTLKGAAYTVGCDVVGRMAHRAEDILGAIRERRLRWSPAVVDTLFRATDAIKVLLGTPDAPGGRSGRGDRGRHRRRWPPWTLDDLAPAEAPLVEAPGRSSPEAARHRRPAAPALPAAPAREASAPPETARPGRTSIRVSVGRLDALMNLVGELVIARSRLDRRFRQLERLDDLLTVSRARMSQTVRDFETKYLDPRLRFAEDEARRRSGPDAAGPGRVRAGLRALRGARVRPLRRLQHPGPDDRGALGRPRRDPGRAGGHHPQHRGGHAARPASDRRPPERDHARPDGADRQAVRAVPAPGPRARRGHGAGRAARSLGRSGRGRQRGHRADRGSAAPPDPERRRPRHRAGGRAPGAREAAPRAAWR